MLAAALVGTPTTASAQRYRVHTYTEAQGLPSSAVSAIAQDPEGVIWLATRTGVTSYDGARWTHHAPFESRRALGTTRLAVSSNGAIWVVDRSLVSRFDGDRWRETRPVGTRTSWPARAVALAGPSHDSTLLVATQTGHLLGWHDDRWSTIALTPPGPMLIHGLTVGGDRCYAATDGGVFVVDLQAGRGRPCPWPLPTRAVLGAEYDADADALWLIGESWIARVVGLEREGSEQVAVLAEDLPLFDGAKRGVFAVAPDHGGGLFFGSRLGGFYFHPRSGLERLGRANGLLSDAWTCVMVDREANVWVGGTRGVSKIVSRRFANYDKDNGLFDDEVTAVLERRTGGIVLGHPGGLTFWDRGLRTVAIDTDPLRARVMDLAEEPGGRLWLAVEHRGLASVDGGGGISWGPEIDQSSIRSVLVDARGTLWAATGRSAYRRTHGTFEPIVLAGAGPDGSYQSRRLYEGGDGTIYVATSADGVFAVRAAGQQSWRGDRPDVNDTFAVLERSDGSVWVGTTAGLCVARDDRLELMATPSIRRPVYGLLEDRNRSVWIGTDNGVARWTGDRLDSYDPGGDLVGADVNRAAMIVDSSDQVWIGMDRSVAVYRRHLDQRRTVGPTIGLLHFDAAGARHSLSTPTALDSDARTLTFAFRAISFVHETRVQYRRRLEGFEAEWSELHSSPLREVRYTNLPAGEYRLHLQAVDVDGRRSSVAVSAPIEIRGPLWTRTWFVLVCALLGIGVVAGVVSFGNARRHARHLAREVRDRTDELRTFERDRARVERMESLGLFAGGIAHDFNNLLTAILGNLSLIETDGAAGNDQTRRSVLNVQTSCKRARSLTQQLLTFSRGGAPIQRKAAIADIVRESAALVLEGTNARCEVDLPEDLWLVHIDPDQMSQVLNNLLINAWQAMPDGGTIRVHGQNLVVGPDSLGGISAVLVEIADEGPGIDPEVRDRIFDPYFTTKIGGSGLGLATAHSIVARHAGQLVLAENDGGAAFRLFLPAAGTDATEAESAPEPARSMTGRVLVMDDDPQIRALVARVLETRGLAVVQAADGREAIALYRDAVAAGATIDAVLMDLTVARGMGGLEATRELRQIAPDARVIVTTGYSEDPVLADYPNHGFCAYLAKPFLPADLVGAVQTALDWGD